jgi:hypothetical protein
MVPNITFFIVISLKKKLKMKSFEKITFLKKPFFSNKMFFSANKDFFLQFKAIF